MTTSYTGTTSPKVPEDRNDLERLVKGPNAYRTISEVADELHVPQHVLRFWETRFPEVKPLKRGGGRRYYSPEDIEILRHITDLLYVQGYTIKGVQRVLKEREQADSVVVQETPVEVVVVPVPVSEEEEVARASFDIPDFPASESAEAALPEGAGDEASAGVIFSEEHGMRASDALPDEAEHEALRRPEEDVVDAAEAPMIDPGEETSAAWAQEAPPGPVQDEVQAESVSERDIETVLLDELAELRARQDRWTQERRALRLALEDVLGELDNLRQMVPTS